MLLLLLIFIATFALWFHIHLVHQHWKKKNVPYVPGFPFIGTKTLALMQESIGTYLHGLYSASKGKFMGFYVMGKPAILIKDVDLMKKILIKDFQFFYDRTMGHNKSHDPIGAYILFVVPNPDWRQLRKNMSPAFSSGKMKAMAPLLCKTGEEMIDYVSNRLNRSVDPKDICAKYSTDVITSCAFGVDGNCFRDEKSLYYKAARNIFDFNWIRGISFASHFLAPFLLKPFRMKFLDPFSARFLRKVMWECVDFRITTKTTRNDFIDSIIEINDKVDDAKFHLDSHMPFAMNPERGVILHGATKTSAR